MACSRRTAGRTQCHRHLQRDPLSQWRSGRRRTGSRFRQSLGRAPGQRLPWPGAGSRGVKGIDIPNLEKPVPLRKKKCQQSAWLARSTKGGPHVWCLGCGERGRLKDSEGAGMRGAYLSMTTAGVWLAMVAESCATATSTTLLRLETKQRCRCCEVEDAESGMRDGGWVQDYVACLLPSSLE